MLGAERLLVDLQRALAERPGAGEITLGPKKTGEVVETRRGQRDGRGRAPSRDRQRALEERPRGCEVALSLKEMARLLRLNRSGRDAEGRAPSQRIASARS